MNEKQYAQSIWESMSQSEKTGVKFGMFPLSKMNEAKQNGIDERILCLELMSLANKK